MEFNDTTTWNYTSNLTSFSDTVLPTGEDGTLRLEWILIDVMLCVLVILVHSLGSYALWCIIQHEEEGTVQHVLIMNASLTEIGGTIMYLIYMFTSNFIDFTVQLGELITQMQIIVYVLFTFMYSMNFMLITVDRLLYIVLGIKYDVYCTLRRYEFS